MWIYLLVVILLIVIAIVLYIIFVRPRESAGLSSDNNSQLLDFILEPDPTPAKRVKFEKVIDNSPDIITQLIAYAKLHNLNSARFYSRLNDLYHPKTITSGAGPLVSGAGPELVELRKKILTGLCDAFVLANFDENVANAQETLYDAISAVITSDNLLETKKDQFWKMSIDINNYEKKYTTTGAQIKILYEAKKKENEQNEYDLNGIGGMLKKREDDEKLEKLRVDYTGYENGSYYANNKAIITAQLADPTSKLITRLKKLNDIIRLAIKNNELIIKSTSEQAIKNSIRQTYNNTDFVDKVFTSFKALYTIDDISNTLIGYPTIDHIFKQKDVNLIESLAGCDSAGITLAEIKNANIDIVKNCEKKYIENFVYRDAFRLDLGNTEKSKQTLNYYQALVDTKVNREECKKKYIAARITELKNDLSSKKYLKELQDTILTKDAYTSALRELINILPADQSSLEQRRIDNEATIIAEKYTAYEMKKILWVIAHNWIGQTQEKIDVMVMVPSRTAQREEAQKEKQFPSTDYVYRQDLGRQYVSGLSANVQRALYEQFSKRNRPSSEQERLFEKSKGDEIRKDLLLHYKYFIQYYDWVKDKIEREWSDRFDEQLAETALEADKAKTPNIDIIATWCRANEGTLATIENDIIMELGTKNKDILKRYTIPPSANDIYDSVKALPPYNGNDNALLMAIGNKVKDWMMNQPNGLEADWLITNKRNSLQVSYTTMYPSNNASKVAALNDDLINSTMPFIKKIYDDLLKTVMTNNPDAYTIHLGNEVIKKLGGEESSKYMRARLKFIEKPDHFKPQKDAIIAKYKFIFDNRLAVDAEVPIQNIIITNACPSASTDPEKLVCITKEAQFYDTMFKQYNEKAAARAAAATAVAVKIAAAAAKKANLPAPVPAPAPKVPVVLTRDEWLTTLNFVEIFELRQIMNQTIRDLDIEMNKIMDNLSLYDIIVVMDDTQFKKELKVKLKPIIDTAYLAESGTIQTTFSALSDEDKIKQLNEFAEDICSSLNSLLSYKLPTDVKEFKDNSIADLTNLYNKITQTKKDAVKGYSDIYKLDSLTIKKKSGMAAPSPEWSTVGAHRGPPPMVQVGGPMSTVSYLQARIDTIMKGGRLPAVATKNNYEIAMNELQKLFYEHHKKTQIISLRDFLKENAVGAKDLFKALIYYITSSAAPVAITDVLVDYLKPAGRLNADGSPIFTSDTNIGRIKDTLGGKMQDLANGLATTKYETLNKSLEALIKPPAAPDIASAIANAKKAQDTIKTAIKTVDIAVVSADASNLKVAASTDAAAKITANTAKIAANTAKTAMTTAQGSADAAVIAASAAGITLDNANIEAKKAEDAAKAALMELTKAVDAASTAAAEVAKIAAPAAAVPAAAAAGPAPLTAAAAIVDATTAEETATEAFAVITAALETADAAVKSAENIERKFPAGTTAHTAVVANTTAAKTAKGLVDNIKRVAKAANDSVKAQVITAKDPATLVPNAIAAANTAKTDAKTVLTEASKAAKAAKDAVDAAAHAAVVPTPVLAAPAPIIIHEEEEPTIIYKDVYTPLDHKLLNTTDPDDTIKIMYRNLRERNPHFPTTTNVGKMTSYLNNWLDEGKSNSSPKDFIKNYVNYRHSTKKPVNLINIDDTYEQNQKKLLS